MRRPFVLRTLLLPTAACYMLDTATKTQLKVYLDKLVEPIVFKTAFDNSDASRQMAELLADTAGLSDKISVVADNADGLRRPSFSISGTSTDMKIRFAALPMGHEFASFILAMLQASGYPSKADPKILERIRTLSGDFKFEVFMSLTCHNCPDVVQALTLMASLNPNISTTVIDGGLFEEEVRARHVLAVPAVFLNGEPFLSGRRELVEIVEKLDSEFASRNAAALSEKPVFDVLVLGAGPAGATAAIYAARKGLRTGIVAERLGGQVNETADIENFTSQLKVDGPALGSAFMRHVQSYGVDTISPAVADSVERTEDGLWRVRLESGAELRTKTLIGATGARWRTLDVPGEDDYRGKGVAYCPHCDGPLFKGKDVAVIGGGNSGVEAAIDLAGICRSVTLLQRGSALTADEVLQKRLAACKNATVILNTAVSSLEGDGQTLTGIRYTDKTTGEDKTLSVAGAFVQIGLIPNTEWAAGTLERNAWNEIVVDSRCRTSAEALFAAGDCTDVPYKQIVIALGEGAKAALSAFDWLIRNE